MEQFYLLLHQTSAAFANVSPAEMQGIIGRYTEWRRSPGVTGGHKLEDGTGRVLRGGQIHDGPFTEGKEHIGGLFIIQAEGFDEAVAIARTCPHCEFGAVEVRAVDLPPAA